MAFTDAKVVCMPGGNSAPGLVIVFDPTVPSADIAEPTTATARTYFSRVNALPRQFSLPDDRLKQDEHDLKTYEGLIGMVKSGRPEPRKRLTNNESKSTIGAVLMAVGNTDPVFKRLSVVNPGTPGSTSAHGGFYDPTKRSVAAGAIGIETLWVI